MTTAQLRLTVRLYRLPADQWYRSARHGERVTLASLHTRGLAERRAWRGVEGHPDAAHEYRLTATMRAAIDKARAKVPA